MQSVVYFIECHFTKSWIKYCCRMYDCAWLWDCCVRVFKNVSQFLLSSCYSGTLYVGPCFTDAFVAAVFLYVFFFPFVSTAGHNLIYIAIHGFHQFSEFLRISFYTKQFVGQSHVL